jgi:hypothetical protein
VILQQVLNILMDSSQDDLVAALAAQGAPEGAIRLQCDPRRVEQHLIQHLPEEFELDPRSFAHVLYVVELDDEPQVRRSSGHMLSLHGTHLSPCNSITRPADPWS